MTAQVIGQDDHDPVSNAAFGFWLYIMTDCVLFASIFATFAVLHHNYAGGPTGKDLFNLPEVFAETVFLLISSVAYGFTMLALYRNERGQVLRWLIITALFGLGFIGIEITEFRHLIMAGNGPDRSGFLSAFFTLVGTHGAHVSVGLIWMAVMMFQVMNRGLTIPVKSRLMRLGIFWHFLDVIWICVFTVVYLMGAL
ncbi:MAG: cytochrome o ubiquinol oxidase subunit III [Betaproteobacteria bacterium]|nr:cytochrome o ubiquinol oxidase subunit III [Betaproteobacteria bacterium]